MFYQKPSKSSVLDEAGLLPNKLEIVKQKIKYLIDEANIQSAQELLADALSYPDLVKDDLKNVMRKCTEIFFYLEDVCKNLYELADSKRRIKENSRHRDETIKTGKVKEKIDKLLPDSSLNELAKQLEDIYIKLNPPYYAMFMMALNNGGKDFIDTLNYKKNRFSKLYQLISNQPKEESEVNSIWLHNIMSKCMDNQKNLTNNFSLLLIFIKKDMGEEKFLDVVKNQKNAEESDFKQKLK